MVNLIQDATHAAHRNKIFLINYTEYMYRVLLKKTDYPIQEIGTIVEEYADSKEVDDYFDKFTIKFTEWCVTQPWDKTSASLGTNEHGDNIAKSTKDLLEEFKQYLNVERL